MKKTLQFTIIEVPAGIAIAGPYHPGNNKVFRDLHGHYEREARHWILLPTAECRATIVDRFGKKSPSVVARVTAADLGVCDQQLVLSGYVVASWDERTNTIRMPIGVEIVAGAWDEVASQEHRHPCMAGSDFTLFVVVRQDFAISRGLKIDEELGDEAIPNPLQHFSDSELRAELERRGYRVEKPPQSLF